MTQHEQLFIGVDGGGTKCKARLESSSGALLAEAVTGPANPATDFALAVESILQACQQVVQQAGYTDTALAYCHVVMGLAGVNVPRVQSPVSYTHLTLPTILLV